MPCAGRSRRRRGVVADRPEPSSSKARAASSTKRSRRASTCGREGSRPRADPGVHLSREYDPQGRSPGAVLAGYGDRPRSGWRRRCRSRTRQMARAPGAPAPIVLNEWTARELGASRWRPHRRRLLPLGSRSGLHTRTASFTVAAVDPDRRLRRRPRLGAGVSGDHGGEAVSPSGIRRSRSISSRVRPQDESYWDEYRTTPKAFIPLRARQGAVAVAVRRADVAAIRAASADAAQKAVDGLRAAVSRRLSPAAMGVALMPARAAALDGRAGRDRLRRVLHLLQLLPRRLGAAARRALLQARRRAAAEADRRAARGRLHPMASSGGS